MLATIVVRPQSSNQLVERTLGQIEHSENLRWWWRLFKVLHEGRDAPSRQCGLAAAAGRLPRADTELLDPSHALSKRLLEVPSRLGLVREIIAVGRVLVGEDGIRQPRTRGAAHLKLQRVIA